MNDLEIFAVVEFDDDGELQLLKTEQGYAAIGLKEDGEGLAAMTAEADNRDIGHFVPAQRLVDVESALRAACLDIMTLGLQLRKVQRDAEPKVLGASPSYYINQVRQHRGNKEG
jgi:hypothetical protein